MSCRITVINPLTFYALEIHVVIQCQRVGPRKMLKELNSGIDGHPVRDTRLHVVAKHLPRPATEIVRDAVEEHCVHIVDVCFSIQCITHAQALVPTLFARFAHILAT